MVTVPAFGLARYTLQQSKSNSLHSVSTVTLYNSLPSHYGKGYVCVTEALLLFDRTIQYYVLLNDAELKEITGEVLC